MDYSKLQNKRILITGGTGLIGSGFVKYMLFLNQRYSLNIKLILFVRSIDKAVAFFGDNPFIEYIVHDVTKPINIAPMDIDYYLLAACNAYPKAYKTTPVDVMNANYLGVNHVFNYIIKSGENPKNVVFVSSSEVYGEYECGENGVDEQFDGVTNHFSIRACYTESKRATETLCLSYAEQYGIAVSIARPGYIFGPIKMTENNRADVEFFKCVVNKNPIILKSAGTQRRSYCYVKDAISALLVIMLYGGNKEAYNIALDPNESITIAEFAALVAKHGNVELKYSPVESNAGWSPFSKAILNNKKIKQLGWAYKFSVEDGIVDTIKQMER